MAQLLRITCDSCLQVVSERPQGLYTNALGRIVIEAEGAYLQAEICQECEPVVLEELVQRFNLQTQRQMQAAERVRGPQRHRGGGYEVRAQYADNQAAPVPLNDDF